MKINSEIFNSPVLQGGDYDWIHTSSPQDLGNFKNYKIKFPKSCGGVMSFISHPALKDGAIDCSSR